MSSQYNNNILQADYQGQAPYNQRKCPEQIFVTWIVTKCRGVDVERTGADIAIDDSDRLIDQPGSIVGSGAIGKVETPKGERTPTRVSSPKEIASTKLLDWYQRRSMGREAPECFTCSLFASLTS
jgi:hypothetical protein